MLRNGVTDMKCPYCGKTEFKVIDSRSKEEKIRRRRECLHCGRRFTTYEVVEEPLRLVVKRDGSIETYDRNKLLSGIYQAIKKRPVTVAQVNSIADEVEDKYTGIINSQMTSDRIGAIVLACLRDIDAISYIRFASVYQDFHDVAGFIAAISALDSDKK